MDPSKEAFNIKFVITGREDGMWIIRAFNREGEQIGVDLSVPTAKEAWEQYMFLNAYHLCDITQIIERQAS